MYVSISSGMGMPSNGLYSKLKTFKRFAMATLKIKWLSAITVFTFILGAFFFVNGMERKEERTPEVKTTQTSNFLVNKSAEFSPRATVDIDLNCESTDPRHCVYELTAEGMANIPSQSSYTPDEIDEYLLKGWIEAEPDSSPGLYAN